MFYELASCFWWFSFPRKQFSHRNVPIWGRCSANQKRSETWFSFIKGDIVQAPPLIRGSVLTSFLCAAYIYNEPVPPEKVFVQLFFTQFKASEIAVIFMMVSDPSKSDLINISPWQILLKPSLLCWYVTIDFNMIVFLFLDFCFFINFV